MRNKLDKKIPLVIKIAPDLTDEEMKDIAQVALRKNVSMFLFLRLFKFKTRW